MIKKRILFVFGTRPEAIKLCPLVKAFESEENNIEVKVCVTAQHREMLDQVLDLFEIEPHFDLDLMKPGQELSFITGEIIKGVQATVKKFKPELVIVQGDTTTAFGAALAAYYEKVSVSHVEAGLRTGNIYSPWPEEINRRLIGQIAQVHFAPTKRSQQNLLREGFDEESVIVTGNTVVDALFWMLEKIKSDISLDEAIANRLAAAFKQTDFSLEPILSGKHRLILVTGHRRENFGEGFFNICNALKKIAIENTDVDLVYPVHLNPNVQEPVFNILGGEANVHLIEPLEYDSFVYLMNLSSLILTDSGGVQEEAPSLGKPVLVMRDTTERPEAVEAGTVKLVGTHSNNIYKEATNLLHNSEAYDKMAKAHNPYGDGTACQQILNYIQGTYFGNK